ncbi:MAG: uroporphyrinogen decarboxylase family protein [Opitutaceae bacterium]
MEAFGRIHPSQRRFDQWLQMSEAERDLHRKDLGDLYVTTLRRFDLSGMIFNEPKQWRDEDIRASLDHARAMDRGEHAFCLHGDATFGVPDGEHMMEFVMDLADHPRKMKDLAARRVDERLKRSEAIRGWGTVDVLVLCADYCFNQGPFLSPAMFDEFVTPYLTRLIRGSRELGFHVIKHTDGNIMPILDSLLEGEPHALHSLDPQGQVDLAEVKRRVGHRVCLIGNVSCAALQTGTDDEVVADARRALRDGMPGGGYVFGTSNCIYTGMALERYELMLKVWREEGVY